MNLASSSSEDRDTAVNGVDKLLVNGCLVLCWLIARQKALQLQGVQLEAGSLPCLQKMCCMSNPGKMTVSSQLQASRPVEQLREELDGELNTEMIPAVLCSASESWSESRLGRTCSSWVCKATTSYLKEMCTASTSKSWACKEKAVICLSDFKKCKSSLALAIQNERVGAWLAPGFC